MLEFLFVTLCLLCFAALIITLAPARRVLLALGALHTAVGLGLAMSGVFHHFDARPPRLLLFALGTMVLGVGLARTPPLRRALDAAPLWKWVALQSFRLPLELLLHALFAAGLVPRQMTWEGQNFDVLVGLSAPALAWLVFRQRAPRWLLIGWNVASSGLLINVVRIAVTSFPGPLHASWGSDPFTLVADAPWVFLPGFLVPLAAWGQLATARGLSRTKPLSSAPLAPNAPANPAK